MYDGVITDITERKRASDETQFLTRALEKRVETRTLELQTTNEQLRASEASLRESEERFGKAFRLSPAHIAIARFDDGRFLDLNESFLVALGKRREEVVGRSSGELNLWVNLEDRNRFFEDLRRDGFIYQRESLFHGREGDIRTVLHSAELIDLKGVRCILSIALDITARKQAETELHQALAKEKELVELKSSFVSMVSHEFRTPLSVIVSSAEIMDRYFDRLAPEKRVGQLVSIRRSAERMARLINDVLLLGRVEAGRIQCKPEPIDLPAFARDLIDEVHAATSERCPVEFAFVGELEGARADEELLRTALENLLTNAVKYSPAGAPVRLELRREGGSAMFAVQNKGPGIPAGDHYRLFQAFERGGNAGSVPGTGLGLSIAMKCAEVHGGGIEFLSDDQNGTTFTLRLPLFIPIHIEQVTTQSS